MTEALLIMSGDFEEDFSNYNQTTEANTEAAMLTIVECGSENCTALLC
ncbi:hypothetical protein [Pseudomonas sp. CCC3.1]|nr:hypothetical protein [Pseudomonas sp. CCC3.1]MEB0206481.1 hypothetical protein [Pseudomonas sp. CCC3.1]WPX34790.1 hypothetical protein RHM56_15965 [Pseudomonas sp. CCC3.1]